MKFLKVILAGMMLVTFSLIVYGSVSTLEGKITGLATKPACPVGEECGPGIQICGDNRCTGNENCNNCPEDCYEAACETGAEIGDPPTPPEEPDRGDLYPLIPGCSDGTPVGSCSLTVLGQKCVAQGNNIFLTGACSECQCQPGYMCDLDEQECLPARTCEEASALCLLGPECPGNTTALSQFNRHCNLVSVGIPKPTFIPKICCWPNQDYWNDLGGGNVNQTITQETYSDLREMLGICIDQSQRDSCNDQGQYCTETLDLVQDCTKCGCSQGLLCYQTQCVTPEEYDRLAFFGDILQFNKIERILVVDSQNKVYDISSSYSPGEFAQSFSPLYSGAQDIVPNFSPSTTPNNNILLSAVVPERDNDKFAIEVGLKDNKVPTIKINFNS